MMLSDILQYAVSGISVGSIYAIVALGFTIIFSSTELVNFAQGEFVMLGAMFSFTFGTVLGWPPILAVPAAAAMALVAGLLLGLLLTRPRKDASQVSLIILTVGASMLIQGLAGQFWGKDAVSVRPFTEGKPILFQLPIKDSLPIVVMPQQVWLVALTLGMVLLLTLFFGRTMAGKALRAVASNRTGSRLVGISVNRLVMGAFSLSALMGAVAGAAVAPVSCGYFNMGTMLGMKGFAAAIVGGLGSFTGSIAAGLAIGLMEGFSAGFLSSDYKDAIAFIILLAVLFVSPSGITGLFHGLRRGKA